MYKMKSYIDLRQTEYYSKYIKKLGWKVDKYGGVNIYSKRLLLWNFVKIQRPEDFKADKLNNYLTSNYRYSTIYVEAKNNKQYNSLLKFKFKSYNSPFLPTKTIWIDLKDGQSQLLKKMHQKTRYNIKVAERNNLKIVYSKDIERFSDFWQNCAKERGMFLNQKREISELYNAFNKSAKIYVALDGKSDWLAGILSVYTKDVSYYMYAASTKKGKKLYAPTLLIWEVLKSEKNDGKSLFDFEGIYDERFPLKTWRGFTRFKKGFGGTEKEYPGCLSKVIF